MLALFLVCGFFFFILVWHTRLVGVSLGLPIAYLFALLLQHLPGAFAHIMSEGFFKDSSATQVGLRFTTIGVACFVVGVVLAQRIVKRKVTKSDTHWLYDPGMARFAVYCLLGGWIVVWITSYLGAIPSLRAAVERGGTIWICGVLIGFVASVQQGRYDRSALWLGALSVYPAAVLIWGGFLSFGSTSIFIVMSALLVVVKSQARAYAGVILFSVFSFLGFLSYYQYRLDVRSVEMEGASVNERAERASIIFLGLEWFSSGNPYQLNALDERLNQNQFIGWAAQKIEHGEVSFLAGRTLWEGLQALVPRALWPGKPIFAGSSDIIRETTDFAVNDTTTFGVGLVMEFYVNFGVPSLIVGFLLTGFAFGWIDRNAAAALQGGDFGRAIVWFLPGVAINAPLATVAELTGNVAAALVGAWGWRFAWGFLDSGLPVKRPWHKKSAGIDKKIDETVPSESK